MNSFVVWSGTNDPSVVADNTRLLAATSNQLLAATSNQRELGIHCALGYCRLLQATGSNQADLSKSKDEHNTHIHSEHLNKAKL